MGKEKEQEIEFLVEPMADTDEPQFKDVKKSKAPKESPEEDAEEKEESSVQKILHGIAVDEEEDNRVNWTIPNVLVGEVLKARWFRKHIWLMLLVLVYIILYISNRYAAQQELLTIDKLKEELVVKKYDALSRSSQLLQRCRQSQVEEALKQMGDTTLKASPEPPFRIK